MIAIISMFVDHIGSIILERELIKWKMVDMGAQVGSAFFDGNMELYNAFFTCKMIGRIAFPIFAFYWWKAFCILTT